MLDLYNPAFFHPEKGELILRNQKITDRDIKEEIMPFLDKHPEIKKLDVAYNFIYSGKAFAINQTLTHLNIKGNYLKKKGACVLANNKMLTNLNISFNNICDEGAIALANNKKLAFLNVRFSNITDEGAVALAKNKNLISLNIRGNDIKNTGALAFAENTTLDALNIRYNDFTDKGALALANNAYFKKLEAFNVHIDNQTFLLLNEKNPIKIANAGRKMDLNASVPTLRKLSWFAVTKEMANYSQEEKEALASIPEDAKLSFIRNPKQ